MGLKGMRERAAIAGGRLVVGPLPPGGTLVSASLPLADGSFIYEEIT
jgi:signal transduction histidine kinase